MAVTLDLLGASLVYSLPLVGRPAARRVQGPADIAFDGAGKILVTNHAAFTEVLRDFSIAEADVDDRGARLFTPQIP